MKLRRHFYLVGFVFLCVPGLLAQRQTFTVAPEQSTVAFTVGGVVHSVHGTFSVQDGSIQFDSDSGEISGSIEVAAGSGKSGDKKRDRRMTTEVLQARKFAVVSFTPQNLIGSIAPSGNSTVQVTGAFTLHGTPHELTVPAKVEIDGSRCRVETSFLVPYVRWGLKDPSNLMIKIGKEVEINLILVGRISPAA